MIVHMVVIWMKKNRKLEAQEFFLVGNCRQRLSLKLLDEDFNRGLTRNRSRVGRAESQPQAS